MYVRPPNPDRRKIKVPENYSGNAFIQESRINEMPPPVRQLPPLYDLPPSPSNEEEHSEDNDSEEIENGKISEHIGAPSEKEKEDLIAVSASQNKNERSSIFSSLLPPCIDFSSRFPFGHGIGREEVIILAVMLLVYLSGNDSDECDHELILLLGLLLLAG